MPHRNPDPPAHLAATWRFLRALGCNPATADELTQETFLRAAKQGATARAWLFKVARNLFIDRCRADRKGDVVAWTESVERELADCLSEQHESEATKAARECVAALTPRARRIVHLFYTEDRSRQEIATELGMTEAGVKTALQRARQLLKTCIETKLPWDQTTTTESTKCSTPS